jgi:hypothetical protein
MDALFTDKLVTNKAFKRKLWLECFQYYWHLLTSNPLGDPIVIPFKHVINLQKVTVGIMMFALMYYYDNFSNGCWIYLALHGGYGLAWIFKDRVFPDASFEEKISLSAALFAWIFVLGIYALIPIAVASRWA